MSPLLTRLSHSVTAGIMFVLALVIAPRLAADFGLVTQGPSNPVLPRQYAPGSSVTMSGGNSTPSGSCQWYHDGQPIPGATALVLALSNLANTDSGNYELRVTAGNTVTRSSILPINVLPLPASSVDTTFAAQFPSSGYYPTVLFALPDNSLLVRPYDGSSNPPIIRLNSDGSLDLGFHYPATAGSLLAASPTGQLIVGNSPYRLNANGSAQPLVLPAGFDSAKALTGAAYQPNGQVLIAQGNLVARLNADDSVDASFSYSTTLSSAHSVSGFKLDATGRIYATATERDPIPGHFPQSWTVVYRLAPTGAEDITFSRQEPPLRRGGIALYPFADGRLLRYASYEGIVYWAMLKDDGSSDSTWSPGATTIPTAVAVDAEHNRIFSIESYNTLKRATITATALVNDPSFYPGDGYPSSLSVTPSGLLVVSGSFIQWDGHPTSQLVRLLPDVVVYPMPPVASIGPGDATPSRGSTLTFTSGVTGTGPFTYQWLALDGQPLPADTTSASLAIGNFSTVNFGRYQLRVTGIAGSVLSNVTRAIYNPSQLPYLANLSGRAFVGTGDDTAIAGMAVKINAGALGVSTLLRGAGPALQGYGVTGFLPNPMLNLYSATDQLLANNDTWGGTAALQTAADAVGAFPFSAESNDAALLATFGTGRATLQLLDQSNASGVGLLEIYRVPNSLVAGEITNLSLRARTGPGEKVAIAGVVVVDPQGFDRSVRLLIRVVGPTLSQYGVAFPLADPVLTLYDVQGRVVTSNDNWSDGGNATALSIAMQAVGAFSLPANSKDAAVLLDLPAGVYSVQATSAAGTPTTGVTLIEIYLVR